jgi:hypothetical protein
VASRTCGSRLRRSPRPSTSQSPCREGRSPRRPPMRRLPRAWPIRMAVDRDAHDDAPSYGRSAELRRCAVAQDALRDDRAYPGRHRRPVRSAGRGAGCP